MNGAIQVRSHANGFALVANMGKSNEYVIASRIGEEHQAKLLASAYGLAEAAAFALQWVRSKKNDALSEAVYSKLELALRDAGIELKRT